MNGQNFPSGMALKRSFRSRMMPVCCMGIFNALSAQWTTTLYKAFYSDLVQISELYTEMLYGVARV